MTRSPRQPLPRGDWAIPGQTLAARMEAIRTEARAYDIPTFRPNKRGLILAGLCSFALWVAGYAAVCAVAVMF